MSSGTRTAFRPRYNNRRDKPQEGKSYFNTQSSSSTSKDFRDRPPQYSDSQPKIKPNFKPSGLLAKESNNIEGIQLKYVAPEDAIASTSQLAKDYYIYIYPQSTTTDPIKVKLNTRTHHLIGRDAKVCDIITSEESVSKQHAVIQFRKINDVIKPYVIDLESSNGTVLNQDEIPQGRFVELFNSDILKFGDGIMDYVFMISD